MSVTVEIERKPAKSPAGTPYCLIITNISSHCFSLDRMHNTKIRSIPLMSRKEILQLNITLILETVKNTL